MVTGLLAVGQGAVAASPHQAGAAVRETAPHAAQPLSAEQPVKRAERAGPLPTGSAAALPADPVDYAYDAAGQLRSATQGISGGSSARYDYDESGNLTAIDRYSNTTLAITGVVPARAPVGAKVTIGGTGFAGTAAGNTVSFNGTTATVTDASPVRLVVTVPAGASSGTITVRTATGSATSRQPFTVDPAAVTPSISGFSPGLGAAGDTVTIAGTGFAGTTAGNSVAFGATRARVTAASATSLTVTVPGAAGSGRITVATAAGTATSGGDFVAVPRPYHAADVATTGVLAVDGASGTVTVPTAGKIAVYRFAGRKGQRLSLGLTGSTFANDFDAALYTPYGGSFARDQFDEPWSLASLFGGLALPTLPASGTYQLVIDPKDTGTGSVSATLSSRVVSGLSFTGAPTGVALNRAGQQAELTFAGTAGQRVSLGFTGSTFATGTTVTAKILEPTGTPMLWASSQDRGLVNLSGEDLDFTTTQNGTYTVLFGSTDFSTGSVTVTVSAELNAGALSLGASKNVSIARAGQNARMTFAGTAGQRLSLDFTAYTFAFYPAVAVFAPDGSVLGSANLSSFHYDLPTLPSTGTYAIVLSPYSSTGSLTARLTERQDAGTVSATGAAVTVTIAQAGRTADLAFTAVAGQRYSVAFSSWTFPASAGLRVQVLNAAGATVTGYLVGSLSTFWFTAATAGTYRMTLTPDDGVSTGSTAVTLSQEIAGGALTIGAAKTVSAPRLGQTTRLTFTGTAGQRLSLSFGSYAFPHTVGVQIVRPDGAVLRDGNLAATQLDLDPLPTAGTYQIVIYPYAETGSAQLTLVERVDAGATTVGGAAKTLTVSQTGRYAETGFTATAGQRLSFGLTNWTFASGTVLRARVLDAAGTAVSDWSLTNGGSFDARATAAGTYRLIIGPTTFTTGAVTLTLSEQINAGTVALNSSKTVTFGRAGQSARMTYAGTAGQNLALQFTGGTVPFYPNVLVLRPDGTTLTQNSGGATVAIPTLPSTGTYEIDLSPYSFTGSITFTLTTRSALAAAGVGSDVAHLFRAVPARPAAPAATAHPLSPPRVKSAQPAGFQEATAAGNARTWTPDQRNLAGEDWNTHQPAAPPRQATARKAPAGTTALSGQALALNGKPLPGITVSVLATRATTDAQGRFLLAGLPSGHRVLRVDGGAAYGRYDIGVDLTAGKTTVLPYPVWLSQLDSAHAVSFPSPTTREVVLTTPAIPGLEVRLPAGTVVRDVDGAVVTKLGITAIPADRPPFPLPKSQVPAYFTVQPGSSYVFPRGARVIYPNFTHATAGAKMDFWHYDPAGRGWFVYGHGSVTADRRQVVPDPGTEVYQFTGAMLITPGTDPPPAAAPAAGGGASGADPVDLGSGLIVDRHTDLTLSDVMPVSVTRTYQQSDTGRRSFGIGVNSDYDIYLYSEQQWVQADLILPDGSKVHYRRITPGGTGTNEFLSAAFAADPTPTRFNKSTLAWNGDGWDVRLRDGTTYVFGDEAPLREIRDRFGNAITITRAPAAADPDGIVRAKGPITQVTSPGGKWIAFTRDAANRVTRAEDNLGRAVTYTYTSDGHLATVTDANGGVTTYTYASGRLASARDPRGTVYLTNTYDAAGRISKQTAADGSTFQLAYTTDANGRITETRLTDPRGTVRRVTFNAQGFTTSDTAAFGTASAQTLQISRDAVTNLPTAYVDALGRRIELTYDAAGNVTGITELAGTAQARTTRYVYNGPFNQLTQITDPLGHVTAYTYGDNGALRTITDPVSRVTTLETTESGQVTKVTDNAGKATGYGYTLGDPSSVTDPLGRIGRQVNDGAGRAVRVADPDGATAQVGYDALDQVRSITDPLGRQSAFEYDPNGNLTKVTDARAHATGYTYDALDRVTRITDPLGRAESYGYDANGSLTSVTSRDGTVTGFDYDVLDRLTAARYGVSGSTSQSRTGYTYDAGDRITSVVDSIAGTTTNTMDGLDRMTRSVTPQGQIDYAYDAADRRTSMTVAGQAAVTYAYNNADQLTQEVKGGDSVGIGYDAVGRQNAVTLPGGVTQTYAYDAASQLTGITYTRGSATLGTLTYGYDDAGRTVHVGGSYARADLPAAYGPASYDAANQLTAVGATAYAYDANGNLTSDGTTSYTWDARGQLAALSRTGLSVSFGYDGLGRRATKTNGSTTAGYLYDGLNPVQELTGGTPSANLLSAGVDQVFARSTSAGTNALLTDALGSTVGLVDAGGNVTAEYSYQPYGATTVSGSDAGNPVRFAGREDDGTGLYYNRARYYSTRDHRFLSTDPLGFGGGGTNLYAYVGNQPTGLTDPFGTKPRGPGGKPPAPPDGCEPNSFTADTPVVMADGSRKPISDVRLGDKVLATDPATGKNVAEPVTALIVGEGAKDLVDISVDGGQTVTATAGHAFWVDQDGRADTPGGQWINAAELRHGQWLRAADGRMVRIAGTHAHAQNARVYNLTVADAHDFYVAAGATALLVHNEECDEVGSQADYNSQNDLIDAVKARRIADGNRGGNYGAARLQDGRIITGRAQGKGASGIHAEEDLIQQAGGLRNIKDLYTERAPCAAKCGPMLRDTDVNVTWSYRWNGVDRAATDAIRAATNKALREAVRQLFSSGG
ncbi:hypothetical protein GCM10012284_14360 [Mangrovihabitans endophyticus]|uniref:alpha-amylase n=1 Tax=Mangrovihabitans endophyticus TaxID=1751298 RepID=A0A8J3FM70_9ACTN|nr:hypothetical protein GCM10012284_14360 [Mangrovihabitans endophyticus]